MTHPGSGNPTWQDWPSQATPVSALSLENIEVALDNRAAPPFARYYCNINPTGNPAGQFIAADGTPYNIPFDVAQDTSSAVSAQLPALKFTLQQAGVWTVTAGVRMRISTASTRQLIIWDGTSSVGRFAEAQLGSGAGQGMNVSVTRRFPAGQVVAAALAINAGTGDTRLATDAPESTFISFLWERD